MLESGAQGPAALSAVPHPALSVPATLHASLMARLDRLGPAAKDVAQTGAAIGREFSYELLASTADLPEPQLREALDRLTDAGLLFVRGTPPQSTYIFKHALVQDAAYGTLLRGRRQQLHARIAAPSKTASRRSCGATRAAGPALRGSRTDGKGGRLIGSRPVSRRLARSAMTEAVAQLRKGLDVLAGQPDGPWRRKQELDLQIALGPALAATKGSFGGRCARGPCPSARAGRADRSTRIPCAADGGPMGVSFHPSRAQAGTGACRADRETSARRGTIPRCNCWVTAARLTPFFLGEFIAARSLLERCHGLVGSGASHVGTGCPSIPTLRCSRTSLRLWRTLGYIDQARSRMDEALSEARRLRHVYHARLRARLCELDGLHHLLA